MLDAILYTLLAAVDKVRALHALMRPVSCVGRAVQRLKSGSWYTVSASVAYANVEVAYRSQQWLEKCLMVYHDWFMVAYMLVVVVAY